MISSRLVKVLIASQAMAFIAFIIVRDVAVSRAKDPDFAGMEAWPLAILFMIIGVINFFVIPLYLYHVFSKRFAQQPDRVALAMILAHCVYLGYFFVVK